MTDKIDKTDKINDGALKEWQARCAEYLAGWKRAQADYQNLQKEVQKSRAALVKFAAEDMLRDILPIYDNMKLALAHVPDDQKQTDWVAGMAHIKDMLAKFLADNGVEEIKSVGEKFNPAVHEAVEQQNTHLRQGSRLRQGYDGQDGGQAGSTEAQKNVIIKKEVRAGYKLNGKVIQAARVVV